MKTLLLAAALTALCGAAHAQSASSSTSSTSGVQSNINVLAGASQYTPQETIIRNVPGGVVGPSFSSGHPCAYSPVSVGLAVVGAGASVGGQRIDDACLLAQMGERNSALALIAARNPAACVALKNQGRISGSTTCGGRLRQASNNVTRPQARPAGVGAVAALEVECIRRGNTITPKVTRAVLDTYGAARVKAACR